MIYCILQKNKKSVSQVLTGLLPQQRRALRKMGKNFSPTYPQNRTFCSLANCLQPLYLVDRSGGMPRCCVYKLLDMTSGSFLLRKSIGEPSCKKTPRYTKRVLLEDPAIAYVTVSRLAFPTILSSYMGL